MRRPLIAMVIVLFLLLEVPVQFQHTPVRGDSTTSGFAGGFDTVIVTLAPGELNGTVDIELPTGADIKSMRMMMQDMYFQDGMTYNITSTTDLLAGSAQDLSVSNGSLHQVKADRWWDDGWGYSYIVDVPEQAVPVPAPYISVVLNISDFRADLDDDIDMDSFRVVEQDDQGPVVFNASLTGKDRYLAPHVVEREEGFKAGTDERVRITWALRGGVFGDANRTYHFYFDTAARPKNAPVHVLKFWEDVIVAYDNETSNNDHVTIYHMGPNGPIQGRNVTLPAVNPSSVAVGDLDRNGMLDLVIANEHMAPAYQLESYIYEQGMDGSFCLTADDPVLFYPQDVEVSDLDRDGWPDLVFACGGAPGPSEVRYFISSSGKFTEPHITLPAASPEDVDIADVNRDGVPDIIAFNYGTAPLIEDSYIYFGSTVGGPDNEIDVSFNGKDTHGGALGDLNGNGHLDIVMAQAGNLNYLYYSDQDGNYLEVNRFLFDSHNDNAVEVGDFNGDGLEDIVVGSSLSESAAVYHLNSVNGFETQGKNLSIPYVTGVDVTDLDRDGYDDAVLSSAQGMPQLHKGGPNGLVFNPFLVFDDDDNRSTSVLFADMDRIEIGKDVPEPKGLVARFKEGMFTSVPMGIVGTSTLDAVVDIGVSAGDGDVDIWTTAEGLGHWVQMGPGIPGNLSGGSNNVTLRTIIGQSPTMTVLDWVELRFNYSSDPSDVTVDIGSDGTSEFLREGPWIPDVPVVVEGATVTEAVEDIVRTGDPNLTSILIPITIESATPGQFMLFGLDIVHNSPPRMVLPLPTANMNDDDVRNNVLDLDDHFIDPDNDTISYRISKQGLLVTANISIDGLLSLRGLNAGGGNDTILIEVSDGHGNSITVAFLMEVTGGNDPPVIIVKLNSDQVLTNEAVAFDASGSYDPDGTISAFLWTYGDGSGAEGAKVTHTYRKWGEYPVTLKAVDDRGQWNSTSFWMYVGNRAPVAVLTITDPVADSMNPVVIDPSGTHDPDGNITSSILDFGDGRSMSFPGAPTPVVHSYIHGGTSYTVRLTVYDDNLTAATASVLVTIRNRAPVIGRIVAPTSAFVGEKVSFRTEASDPDGNITRFEWDFNNDGDFETVLTGSGNVSHRFDKPGRYTVILKITDDRGASTIEQVHLVIEDNNEMDIVSIGLAVALILVIALGAFMVYRQHVKIRNLKAALVKRDRILAELKKLEADEMELIDEELQLIEERRHESEGGRNEHGTTGTAPPVRSGPRSPTPSPTSHTLKAPPPEADSGFVELEEKKVAPRLATTGIGPKGAPPPKEDYFERRLEKELEDDLRLADQKAAMATTIATPSPPAEEGKEEAMPDSGDAGEKADTPPPPPEQGIAGKVRCPGCRSVIELHSTKRPLKIVCESCGKKGMIR